MAEQKYKTKQQSIIVDYLRTLGSKHFTADELYDSLYRSGNKVARSTVYRHLDKLVEDGRVKKYVTDSQESCCYQYIEDNNHCNEHYHMKCCVCDKLFHVDCEYIDELITHIQNHHKFTIDNTKTIFYGICDECKNKS